MFHPAFAVILFCIPMVGMLIVSESILDKGEDFECYKNQIAITDSRIVFGDTASGGTVAVMGTIRNNSPIPWKEIQFHADFFDAQGKRSDAGEREDYSFYLSGNGTSSFKVSFRREFPITNYMKHEVRVVTAKDARVRW
jgi:hypothetical protein